jgi:hypothetical protein
MDVLGLSNKFNDSVIGIFNFMKDGPEVGPAFISPQQIGIGAAVVLVVAYISFSLQLGLHWQLVIGSIRWGLSRLVLLLSFWDPSVLSMSEELQLDHSHLPDGQRSEGFVS